MYSNLGGLRPSPAPTPPSAAKTPSVAASEHASDETPVRDREIMRVGKYVILETIGEGAFGKVKLGIDEETGTEYAIKMLKKSDIMAQDLIKQVRREITIMKSLDHPCIVNLHGVLTSSAHIYMVMDLISGGELFHLVSNNGMLSENLSRFYFQQLIDGIAHVHSKRIYHRDLKPENLLLSADKSTLKITDFGLSSIKELNPTSELCNTVMGSPHYIPPEIILAGAGAKSDNGGAYDGSKVDIWACGMILYGMLAGCLPFDVNDDDDDKYLYRRIINDKVRYPQHFSKDVIVLLDEIFEKKPEKRANIEQIKAHDWFQLNYVPILPYGNHPGQHGQQTHNKSNSDGNNSGSGNVNIRKKSRKKRHSRKPNTRGSTNSTGSRKPPQKESQVERVGENVIPNATTRDNGELRRDDKKAKTVQTSASFRKSLANSNLARNVSAVEAPKSTGTQGSIKSEADNDNEKIDNVSLRSRDIEKLREEQEEATHSHSSTHSHSHSNSRHRRHHNDQSTPSSSAARNFASIFSIFSPHRRKHSDTGAPAASISAPLPATTRAHIPSTPNQRREMKFLKKSLLTPRTGGRIKSDMWSRTPTASAGTASTASREDGIEAESKSLPVGSFDTPMMGGSWGSSESSTKIYTDGKSRQRDTRNNANTEIAEFGFETSSKTVLSEALISTSSTTTSRRRQRARERSRSRQPGGRERSKSVVSHASLLGEDRRQYIDDKAPASITNLGKYSYSRTAHSNSNAANSNGTSHSYNREARKNSYNRFHRVTSANSNTNGHHRNDSGDRIIVLESPNNRLKPAQTAPVSASRRDYEHSRPTRTNTASGSRTWNINTSYNFNHRNMESGIVTREVVAKKERRRQYGNAAMSNGNNYIEKNDAVNMMRPTVGEDVDTDIDRDEQHIVSVALVPTPTHKNGSDIYGKPNIATEIGSDCIYPFADKSPANTSTLTFTDTDTVDVPMRTNVARMMRLTPVVPLPVCAPAPAPINININMNRAPLLTMTKENPQVENLPSPSAVNYEQRNRSNVFKKCDIPLENNHKNSSIARLASSAGRFVLTAPPDPLCPWLDTDSDTLYPEAPQWAIDRFDIFVDLEVTKKEKNNYNKKNGDRLAKRNNRNRKEAKIFSKLNSTFIQKLTSLDSTEVRLEREKP